MADDTKAGRRALVACVLTWLLPGAGHLLLGRRARGVAFFLIVLAVVALGVAEKGNLSVVTATAPVLTRLQVGVNLALGPAEWAIRKGLYGELVYDRRYRGGTPPAAIERFMRVHKARAEHPASPFGKAYLWTAGLLNLLLMLDVYDLSIGRKR